MKNIYTSEQKRTIIERYISGGETYSQINADTGIAKSTFYSWLKKYNVEKESTKKKTVNFRNFMLLESKVERLENMAEYIKSIQITHSFSRPYVPYDNSVVESFFASLKREELYRTKYRSESEFMLAVSDYMDFFNTRRPHRKLQYRTPEQKEHDYALNNGLSAC